MPVQATKKYSVTKTYFVVPHSSVLSEVADAASSGLDEGTAAAGGGVCAGNAAAPFDVGAVGPRGDFGSEGFAPSAVLDAAAPVADDEELAAGTAAAITAGAGGAMAAAFVVS